MTEIKEKVKRYKRKRLMREIKAKGKGKIVVRETEKKHIRERKRKDRIN